MLGGDITEVHTGGLPNIEGYVKTTNRDLVVINQASTSSSGAFYIERGTGMFNGAKGGTSGPYPLTLGIDASKANSIYGNSDTVMPVSFSLIPQIRY